MFPRQRRRVAKQKLPDLSYDEAVALDKPQRIVKAIRCAKNKDILGWGAAVMPEKFSIPFCRPLHDYFVDTRLETLTCEEAPRDSSKTTIRCMLVPLFQALNEADLFRFYFNIQGTEDKALTINRNIKQEIERNEVLAEIYGDMKGNRWTDAEFVLSNGIVFGCASTGQAIRGKNYLNMRPDYIMADDLYTEEHIHNPQATLKVNEWFWSSLYSCRASHRRWSIHLTGTAINQVDLLVQFKGFADHPENLPKDIPPIKFKSFKQVLDWDKGTVIWPEKCSFEQAKMDKMIMGDTIFNRERQNERHDDKESYIKRSWLYKPDGRNWEFDPHDLFQMLEKEGAIYSVSAVRLGNDPSIGKNMDSDENATALVIETIFDEDGGHDYWIMNLTAGRLSLQERVDNVKDICADQPGNYNVTEVAIESVGGFDDYAQTVISQTDLPVTRVPHVPDKITNLENHSKFFQNGKVHLNRNIPIELKEKLVSQLTTNSPQHDDVRDAVFLTMQTGEAGWGKAYD
jgi:hypothetical protein